MFYTKLITRVLIVGVIITSIIGVICFVKYLQKPAQGKIFFLSKDDTEIWIMSTDGTKKKKIFKGDRIKHLSFSPDGSKILFSSGRNKDSEIWIIDANGKGNKRLAQGRNPTFSPDGKKILFTSGMDKDSEILRMGVDGDDKKMLTKGEYPKFSPDGRKILFFRHERKKHPLYFQLYIINQDGTGIKRLTEEKESAKIPPWYGGPYFSPDSQRILLEYITSPVKGINERKRKEFEKVDIEEEIFVGGGFIKIVGIDGSILGKTRITYLRRSHGLSLDGSKILFELMESPKKIRVLGFVNNLGIINIDGTHKKMLTDDDFVGERRPLFTPDGKRIIFRSQYQRFRRFGRKDPNFYIGFFIMNVDGTGKKIIAGNDAEYLSPSPFLPDGKRIVYAAKHRGKKRVYVMNLDGSGKKMLCDHPDGRIVSIFWEKEEKQR